MAVLSFEAEQLFTKVLLDGGLMCKFIQKFLRQNYEVVASHLMDKMLTPITFATVSDPANNIPIICTRIP